MKKINFIIFGLIVLLGLTNLKTDAMPNPWSDCGEDLSCASKKAGFDFPLNVKNYSVRAMEDMIEIKFPLDKKRIVTVRKSELFDAPEDKNGIKDISGVYNNYPVNKTVLINKCVPFSVRGKKNKFYVVNFAAETGYYSLYCEKGISLREINYFYNLLKEAEAPKNIE